MNILNSGTQAAREKAGLVKRLAIAGILEAVEVGRDYLGLEMLRRKLDGSTTYRSKTPLESMDASHG